jgi:(2S)-methylsuccinyl-CoA dehydrogenase
LGRCFRGIASEDPVGRALGAVVGWTYSDNSLQSHGGNGYALEYQIGRVPCDARIMNVFEGAAEILAQVIAGRLLAE